MVANKTVTHQMVTYTMETHAAAPRWPEDGPKVNQTWPNTSKLAKYGQQIAKDGPDIPKANLTLTGAAASKQSLTTIGSPQP